MLRNLKQIRQIGIVDKIPSLDIAESRMRNDRPAIFSLVRELVHAQFELGDQELTNRLWQDVGDREIDVERVINLMYGCSFHNDEDAMLEVDLAFEQRKSMELI